MNFKGFVENLSKNIYAFNIKKTFIPILPQIETLVNQEKFTKTLQNGKEIIFWPGATPFMAAAVFDQIHLFPYLRDCSISKIDENGNNNLIFIVYYTLLNALRCSTALAAIKILCYPEKGRKKNSLVTELGYQNEKIGLSTALMLCANDVILSTDEEINTSCYKIAEALINASVCAAKAAKFINIKTELNLKNEKGKTALMIAAKSYKINLVRLLLKIRTIHISLDEFGAIDNFGKTASILVINQGIRDNRKQRLLHKRKKQVQKVITSEKETTDRENNLYVQSSGVQEVASKINNEGYRHIEIANHAHDSILGDVVGNEDKSGIYPSFIAEDIATADEEEKNKKKLIDEGNNENIDENKERNPMIIKETLPKTETEIVLEKCETVVKKYNGKIINDCMVFDDFDDISDGLDDGNDSARLSKKEAEKVLLPFNSYKCLPMNSSNGPQSKLKVANSRVDCLQEIPFEIFKLTCELECDKVDLNGNSVLSIATEFRLVNVLNFIFSSKKIAQKVAGATVRWAKSLVISPELPPSVPPLLNLSKIPVSIETNSNISDKVVMKNTEQLDNSNLSISANNNKSENNIKEKNNTKTNSLLSEKEDQIILRIESDKQKELPLTEPPTIGELDDESEQDLLAAMNINPFAIMKKYSDVRKNGYGTTFETAVNGAENCTQDIAEKSINCDVLSDSNKIPEQKKMIILDDDFNEITNDEEKDSFESLENMNQSNYNEEQIENPVNSLTEKSESLHEKGSASQLSDTKKTQPLSTSLLSASTIQNLPPTILKPLGKARTPLMWCAYWGFVDYIAPLFLAEAGIQNSEFECALILAAMNGHTSIVSLILSLADKYGRYELSELNLYSKSDSTALHYAAENGHVETVKVLLSYSEKIHKKITDKIISKKFTNQNALLADASKYLLIEKLRTQPNFETNTAEESCTASMVAAQNLAIIVANAEIESRMLDLSSQTDRKKDESDSTIEETIDDMCLYKVMDILCIARRYFDIIKLLLPVEKGIKSFPSNLTSYILFTKVHGKILLENSWFMQCNKIYETNNLEEYESSLSTVKYGETTKDIMKSNAQTKLSKSIIMVKRALRQIIELFLDEEMGEPGILDSNGNTSLIYAVLNGDILLLEAMTNYTNKGKLLREKIKKLEKVLSDDKSAFEKVKKVASKQFKGSHYSIEDWIRYKNSIKNEEIFGIKLARNLTEYESNIEMGRISQQYNKTSLMLAATYEKNYKMALRMVHLLVNHEALVVNSLKNTALMYSVMDKMETKSEDQKSIYEIIKLLSNELHCINKQGLKACDYANCSKLDKSIIDYLSIERIENKFKDLKLQK